MVRRYVIKAKRSRVNLLDAQRLSSLPNQLALLDTSKEKRDLIKQANPFFYVFGEKLTPNNYEDLYANDHSKN